MSRHGVVWVRKRSGRDRWDRTPSRTVLRTSNPGRSTGDGLWGDPEALRVARTNRVSTTGPIRTTDPYASGTDTSTQAHRHATSGRVRESRRPGPSERQVVYDPPPEMKRK